MSAKVSDHILERLRDWDVRHVFAYPGEGINGLLSAWGRADNRPEFIQARHEEMAAAEAVLRGDSDRAGMMRQGVKAKIQEFLPGHGGQE